MAMKDMDSKLKHTGEHIEKKDELIPRDNKINNNPAELNARDLSSSELKERGIGSLFGSNSVEEEGMQDRGLFDFGGIGRRGKNRGMFPMNPSMGGYGGRGRSPYGRQFYDNPRYGNGGGYGGGGGFGGAGGYGGAGGAGGYGMGGGYGFGGQYPSRYGRYPGGRGGRFGSGPYNLNGNYGRYPGGGYRQQSYGAPYYRDLPLESNNRPQPVAAR